ncbi:MAG: hypothetical protein IJ867_03925 [Clostridia bacterium]|nr:hypothetical protein [Clostridia bacterium]
MIVWIIFLILAFIFVYVGINRGFAKSLISFLVNLFDIGLAFLITRIVVNSSVGKVSEAVVKEISGRYENLAGIGVIETFAEFAMSIFASVIVFYVVYSIVHIINSFVKPVVFYGKVAEKIKFENKIATGVVSVVSVCLTLMVLITPVGIAYNSIVPSLTDGKMRKIPFVSSFYFDKLTEMPDNDNDIRASEEIKYTVNSVVAAVNIANGTNEDVDNVKIFRRNFNKSYFLPTVIGETGSTMAKQWKNGEEFFGVTVEVPEGREGELTIKFLNIIEKWNKKTVVDDVNTMLDIAGLVSDYGVGNFEEEDGLARVLSDEEFTEDLFVVLYANKDFSSMIPAFLEYGFGTAFDYAEIDLKEKYVSNIDVSRMSEEDIRREGRIVSGIIRTVLEIQETSQKYENGELSANDIEKLVTELSKLKDSKVLGDIANEFIYQITNNIANIRF